MPWEACLGKKKKMTKIRLMSDIHLEFSGSFDHVWTPHEEDKEHILLLAGDIGKGMQARHFIEALCSNFRYVLYTCGNHEFYDQADYHGVIRDWRDYSNDGSVLVDKGPDNFYFLYNDYVILDGIKFIGGTMWTSLDDGDVMTMAAAHRIMNDYACIRTNGKLISPDFTVKEHDLFIDFLLKEWEKPFDGKIVVMTHHSPGNELRRKGHRQDRVGSAYFADLEQMIGYHNKATLWVHGHTHRSWDYMINETRVVCNPYGYYNYSTNPEFDSNLIIEI